MTNESAIETEDKVRGLQFLQRKTVIIDEMDLNGLAESWLKYLKINRNRSDNTISSYATDIDQFIAYLEWKKIRSYKIKPIIIDEWMGWLGRVRKNSPRTIARKVEMLRSFYKYLIRIEVIHYNENPMEYVDAPQFEKTVPDSLSLSELNKMLSVIDTSTPIGFRDFLMILLYTVGGLRESELINADIRDFNLESMSVKVKGKGGKERVVMLPESVELARNNKINLKNTLKDYIDNYRTLLYKKHLTSQAVFINRSGNRLGRKSVYDIFVKTAKRAGIERRITPHVARHTCGMLLTELDVDSRLIRQHLGHRSSIMTDHYSKVRDMKYKSSVGVFGNLATRLSERFGLPAEQL